jgi:hypothetical protein
MTYWTTSNALSWLGEPYVRMISAGPHKMEAGEDWMVAQHLTLLPAVHWHVASASVNSQRSLWQDCYFHCSHLLEIKAFHKDSIIAVLTDLYFQIVIPVYNTTYAKNHSSNRAETNIRTC